MIPHSCFLTTVCFFFFFFFHISWSMLHEMDISLFIVPYFQREVSAFWARRNRFSGYYNTHTPFVIHGYIFFSLFHFFTTRIFVLRSLFSFSPPLPSRGCGEDLVVLGYGLGKKLDYRRNSSGLEMIRFFLFFYMMWWWWMRGFCFIVAFGGGRVG